MAPKAHTIRLPGVILDEVGDTYNKETSGLTGSQSHKHQISRKDRRKQERQSKKKKRRVDIEQQPQQPSRSGHSKQQQPAKKAALSVDKKEKKEKKKSTNDTRNLELEKQRRLMAQDEAEMEHYAKLLKMKNYKLQDKGDGLDDLLGDLDFDDFGDGSSDNEGHEDVDGFNEDDISDGDNDSMSEDFGESEDSMDDGDLDDIEASEEEDDELDNADDTWAALKAMKAKKDQTKTKPAPKEKTTSVEDTWAALKALKNKKNGAIDVGAKQDEEDSEEEDFSDFEGFDDLDGDECSKSSSDDAVSDQDEDSDKELVVDPSKQKTNAKENPYRAPSSGAAYIPPSKRAAMAAAEAAGSETAQLLERKVKGLINRLAETNIVGIVNDLCLLYSSYSRSLVNESITKIVLGTTKAQPTVVESFLIVHAALVAGLYRRYGVDFGAYFIQALVETVDPLNSTISELPTATIVNLLVLLCQAYMFEMVSSKLIYDLIRAYLSEISETHVEFLLSILRSAGPQLRSDDPSALKDIIAMLQKQLAAGSNDGAPSYNARTKFLVESVVALKNNRQKLSQSTAEAITRMRKFLGQFSKVDPIQVSLQDVRNIETKGRWWIVGAAYRNNNEKADVDDNDKELANGKDGNLTFSEKDDLGLEVADLSTLAIAQRMNTDVRRAIFVALMSATDYLDSVERITRLRLSNKQEREIPLVIVHCCANEEMYNPFYALVANKLASSDRAIRKAFQFTLWTQLDSFSSGSHSLSSIVHTAKLFAAMAGQQVLSLDILKTADFYTSSPQLRAFLEVFFVDTLQAVSKKTKKSPGELDSALTQLLAKCASDSSFLQNVALFQKAVLESTAMPSSAKSVARIRATSDALVAKASVLLEAEGSLS